MTAVTDTVAFHLVTLAGRVAERFADAVTSHGVKVKHLCLLVAIDASGPASQLELARALRIAPSLVVQLPDHLVALERSSAGATSGTAAASTCC